MSVLVRGMKMPTSCYDCNCFIRDDSDGCDYCCLLMIDIENNNKRDDDCPLVPVPPHGRLIDADAILGDRSLGTRIVGLGRMLHETVIEFAPTVLEAEEGE